MASRNATAVINVHREGPLLPATLRSILDARAVARAAGHEVEILVVADRCDDRTRAVLDLYADQIDRCIEVSHGDLGAARRQGIEAACHDWVFLHDGDDLYSSNWYLAFFEAFDAGRISPRTVYHTEIFARFGDLLDLRQIIDSEDPRFHPFFLAAEWYFSNKSVLHRGLFTEFPLPRNSVSTGIGNEDWTWSCHTLHGGIRHSPLPGTVCFYRVKPQAQSLGLTPGMIHGPSPLFAPENVAALTRARAGRAGQALGPGQGRVADTALGQVDPRLTRRPLPGWFWEEVRRQGAYESLITEFHRLKRRDRHVPLANRNYNVASAVEYVFDGLDARPKIFLFASLDHLAAADTVTEMMLQAAMDHEGGRYQPVLIADEGGQVVSAARLAARYGAKVISTRLLLDHHQLEPWYYQRFLMRPLVQFPQSLVIDLGSDSFAGLFRQFHRTILETCRAVRMVLLDRRHDLFSPALGNIQRNAVAWHAHTQAPVPVTLDPALTDVLSGPALAPCPLDEQTLAALDAARAAPLRPEARPAALSLARILGAATAPPLALQTDPVLRALEGFSVTREIAGSVTCLSLADASGRYVVYLAPGAWLSGRWFGEAARFLRGNAHIEVVAPQITAELAEDDRYIHRWHNYGDANLVFSSMYGRMRRGIAVPLVVMLRAPLPGGTPQSGAALARALYDLAQAAPDAVSACGETVAIATDPRLYPPAALVSADAQDDAALDRELADGEVV
ncbi:MAG: glycosyltransferase family A protein [Pseudomonadota bacterium]